MKETPQEAADKIIDIIMGPVSSLVGQTIVVSTEIHGAVAQAIAARDAYYEGILFAVIDAVKDVPTYEGRKPTRIDFLQSVRRAVERLAEAEKRIERMREALRIANPALTPDFCAMLTDAEAEILDRALASLRK